MFGTRCVNAGTLISVSSTNAVYVMNLTSFALPNLNFQGVSVLSLGHTDHSHTLPVQSAVMLQDQLHQHVRHMISSINVELLLLVSLGCRLLVTSTAITVSECNEA